MDVLLRDDVSSGAERARAGIEHMGGKEVRVLTARARGKDYAVVVAREPTGEVGATRRRTIEQLDGFTADDLIDYRWHISVSARDRVPPWAEFAAIVNAARPGVMFCVPMPPRSLWMNLHPFVLHVHEIKDENLVARWTQEGEAARAIGKGVPS